MSVLSGAHSFVIENLVSNVQPHYPVQTGIDILREASTPEAAVDSVERDYPPTCFPGTREQYIDDITKWATSSGGLSIYWMKGPAGVGKSAIAQTCSEKLKDTGHLGAAFFFSINGPRKDHTRFFPTIAYQLSTVFADYREILDRRVLNDKTILRKTLSSQFRSLIAEPLRELRELGKEVHTRAIFVDGLDECESKGAQAEIVKIIASSVHTGSTPFRWAIFSRPEPLITFTFDDSNIALVTRFVELRISQESDREVELYLRGEFKNILGRRNLLELSSTWPTDGDINILVKAVAGLFAYAAALLRFVDSPYLGFMQALQVALETISQRPTQSPFSPLAHLDAFYMLIMHHIPAEILPSAQLLLTYIINCSNEFHSAGWHTTSICDRLGMAETELRAICHQLHAVLWCREPPAFVVLDKRADLTRSYYNQDRSYQSSASLQAQLFRTQGYVAFHHKSFYDFLINPDRSSVFCVTTVARYKELFDRLVQQHCHYASSYAIEGPKLVLASSVITTSFPPPSWPRGTQFVDSFLRLRAFSGLSTYLSHDSSQFSRLTQNLPLSSWRKLVELDYRKYLISSRMRHGLGRWSGIDAGGLAGAGLVKVTDVAEFRWIHKDRYDDFNPVAFLEIIEKLRRARVIRPYHPQLGSTCIANLMQALSPQRPRSKRYGLYRLGRGKKSVVWYWEFDTEKRYFHEFQTVGYAEAMALYKAEKFNLWNEPSKEKERGRSGSRKQMQ